MVNAQCTYDMYSAAISLPSVIQADAQPRLAAIIWFEYKDAGIAVYNVILAEPAPTKVVGIIIRTPK